MVPYGNTKPQVALGERESQPVKSTRREKEAGRMARNIGGAAIVMAVALLVGQSVAYGVIVEPDDFADNTDISNAVAGVTLSAVGSEVAGPEVYSREAGGLASTGTRVFGFVRAVPGAPSVPETAWWDFIGYSSLRADFAVPTDYVAIDVIADDSPDAGILTAYNAGGVELDSVQSAVISFGEVDTMVISRGSADIAYILAGGTRWYGYASGTSEDDIHLDYLRTERPTAIPEPASAAIALMGLAGLARRRRK